MDNLFIFFSHPATLLILGIVGGYFANKAVSKANANKTTTEGVVLAVDKVVELSGTINTLYNSLSETQSAQSKLKVDFEIYKDGCEDIKSTMRIFFDDTDAIYKNVGDRLILDQVESLKRKVRQ